MCVHTSSIYLARHFPYGGDFLGNVVGGNTKYTVEERFELTK